MNANNIKKAEYTLHPREKGLTTTEHQTAIKKLVSSFGGSSPVIQLLVSSFRILEQKQLDHIHGRVIHATNVAIASGHGSTAIVSQSTPDDANSQGLMIQSLAQLIRSQGVITEQDWLAIVGIEGSSN